MNPLRSCAVNDSVRIGVLSNLLDSRILTMTLVLVVVSPFPPETKVLRRLLLNSLRRL